MITTAFQPAALQQTAFQIVGTIDRPEKRHYPLVGRVPAGSLRVMTIKSVIAIKPVKNDRMV